MKHFIFAVLILCTVSSFASENLRQAMLPYIAQIETQNGQFVYGDGGKAVGDLQIWTVVIDDVNTRCGTNYAYSDRYSRQKSEEIFHLYLEIWGNHYRKKTGKEPTEEVYARIWNGGPYGWRKSKTKRYYNKYVKAKRDATETFRQDC